MFITSLVKFDKFVGIVTEMSQMAESVDPKLCICSQVVNFDKCL